MGLEKIIIFLLFLPMIQAIDQNLISYENTPNPANDNLSYFLNNPYPRNHYYTEYEITRDLTHKYCGQLSGSIYFLLGIALIMWLLEPLFREKLDICYTNVQKPFFDKFYIVMMYKAIGTGMLVLAGMAVWILL